MAFPNKQDVMAHHRRREVWPDAAKGLCIALVVLVHLVSKHYIAIGWDVPAPIISGWKGITLVMEPIRMPLFFAISGYFSAVYFARPWLSVINKRVAPVYLLYVLWLVIYTLFFATFSSPLLTEENHGLEGLLLAFAVGYTGLWYLYALPVYLIIARLCARAPRASLASAAIISVLSVTTIFPEVGTTPSLLRNFLFFLAGSLLTPQISRMAKQRVNLKVGAIGAFFIVMSVGHALLRFATDRGSFGVDISMGALLLAASGAGVIVGVVFMPALDRRLPRVSRSLAWLGQRTLPVYVLHLPLLAVLSAFLDGTSLPMFLEVIYPLVATIAIIFLCLGVSSAITLVGGGWLFDLNILRRRPVPGSPPQPALPDSSFRL